MNFGADTWWLVGIVVTVVISIIGYFLKRTMTKQDKHEEDINHIKLTYVNKDELKEFKGEMRKNIDKMQSDIAEIKENCLTKKDFMHAQNKTDAKLDKLYELQINRGGNCNE